MNARRRPWWRSTYVVLAAAVLFASGAVVVGSTLANFTTETDNGTSTFPGGFVGAASSLTDTPSGYDASLAWTAGTHGPVTGQQLYSLDNGSSSSCPASGYSLVANMASASTNSYTASNPASTTLTDKVGVTTLGTALPAPTTINMAGGFSNVATSLTVTSTTGMPAAPFEIQVDTGANLEDMHVTAKAGNVLTVTRGQDGTSAVAHANGVSVNVATVKPTAATTFPSSNGYTFQIGSEDMVVLSGAGTTTWIVTRGALSTTIATHAAAAPLNQISVPVANATGFPQSGNFTILVDSEQMTVTSGQGTGAQTFIVTRAANSTTAAAHASGAHVFQTTDPINGHYYCYEMVSTSATNWTATASFPATQVGLVVQSITLANGGGGTAGHIDTGDTITIVFNQAPTGITTGSGRSVCLVDTVSPAKIVLGDTGGCAGAGDANDTGVISGLTMAGGGMAGANAIVNCSTSTFSITSSTLTITVGGAGACAAGSGTPVTDSGSGTYTPASTIKSSATTDQALVCTNATYSCLLTTTGTS